MNDIHITAFPEAHGEYNTSAGNIMVFLCYCIVLGVGIINSNIIASLLIIIMIVSFFNKKIYFLLPVFIIYYDYFLVPFSSLSVYRFYSILLLIRLFVDYKKYIYDLRLWCYLPILVYSIFAIGIANPRTGAFSVIDVTLFFYYCSTFLRDKDNLREILKLYVVACVASVITGSIVGSGEVLAYQLNGSWRYMNRFSGTFPDPNYCGLIYIFSIIACVSLSLFKKTFRIIAIVTLGIGMLMTISFTGFIGLALIIVFYLWLTKKLVGKQLIIVVAIMVLLYSLYLYGSANPDTPIIGNVAYRLKAYTNNYTSNKSGGSMAMTRVTMYQNVLKNYKNLPILKQIFGFNTATPFFNPYNNVVAHNDYVDMLYNMGLLLSIIFYFSIIVRTIQSIYEYRKNREETIAFTACVRVLWLYYAFVLSMLTERQFYFILFV